MKHWGILVGALFCLVAVAEEGELSDREWGVRELEAAQHTATETFKADKGVKLYEAISGFSIERTTQGVAARVKINYVDGGQKKVASLFCHEHSYGIDCH